MPHTYLIVDDSKLARMVAARTMAELQPFWTKIESGDAAEAMSAVLDFPIDLALLDFNLPGRNGLELARDLRAAYPAMPIALVTANIQDEIVSAARNIGAAFVPKPMSVDGLRAFVTSAAASLSDRKA